MKLLLSSYSLHPFPLEEIFLLGRQLQADGLELVLTWRVLRYGLGDVRRMAQKYNLSIVSLHQPPWDIFFTSKKEIKKLVKLAQSLDSENLVVHLAAVRRTFSSAFFDWVKTLEKETGVNIAFENGAPRLLEQFPRYCADPDRLENFLASRGVNLALDVPKFVLSGGDPYQFFQRRQGHIKVVHLSGFSKLTAGGFNHRVWHLGLAGHNFDWFGFVSFLKKHNFQGAINLEVFPLHRWLRFRQPTLDQLIKAKEIVKESFEVLKRA